MNTSHRRQQCSKTPRERGHVKRGTGAGDARGVVACLLGRASQRRPNRQVTFDDFKGLIGICKQLEGEPSLWCLPMSLQIN